MFSNPKPGRELALQAYDGLPIPNEIQADPEPRYVEQTRRPLRMLFASVRTLAPPTGRYNCHGLVFASRRTSVGLADDANQLERLLIRDCYQKIERAPGIGDIAVYRNPKTGSIEHTGLVVRLEPIGDTQVVFLWSKWGILEEVEHRVDLTPYHGCAIEYWSLAA